MLSSSRRWRIPPPTPIGIESRPFGAWTRRAVFDRAGWRCQAEGCGRASRLECDHIDPGIEGRRLVGAVQPASTLPDVPYRQDAARLRAGQSPAVKAWDAFVKELAVDSPGYQATCLVWAGLSVPRPNPRGQQRRMTLTQKLTLRCSEIRQRLNEVAGLEGDALTAEIRSESDALGTEFRDVETKLRAAIIAEDVDPTPNPGPADSDPETRERAELVRRSSIGAIFASAVEHRNTAGAEAELQGELSLNANQIPLCAAPAPAGDARRHRGPWSGRADAATDHSLRVPGERGGVSRRGNAVRTRRGSGLHGDDQENRRTDPGRTCRRGRDHRDVRRERAFGVPDSGRVFLLPRGSRAFRRHGFEPPGEPFRRARGRVGSSDRHRHEWAAHRNESRRTTTSRPSPATRCIGHNLATAESMAGTRLPSAT